MECVLGKGGDFRVEFEVFFVCFGGCLEYRRRKRV